MGINILPFKLGELVRPYAIGKLSGVSKSSALATVVVERVLDIIFTMIFFVIVLLVTNLPKLLIYGSYFIIVIIVFVIAFLVFLFYQESRALKWADYIFKLFPDMVAAKLRHILESFIKGLHVFKATEHFVIIFVLTLLMWFGYTLSVYYGFYAFNLVEQYHLTIFSALVIIVFTAVGLMIPAAIGGFGTFHYFCQIGLNTMNVPDGLAVGYAVILHGVSFALISILGLIYLWKENMCLIDYQSDEEAE